MKEVIVQTLSLILSVSHVICQFSHMLHLILTPGSLITAVMSDVTKCDGLKLQTGWKLGLRHWETLEHRGEPTFRHPTPAQPGFVYSCQRTFANFLRSAQ